tara:strand:+ start:1018 stop:2046 length:1029 start_codon:yes stop_codon:yes gene_type:complete
MNDQQVFEQAEQLFQKGLNVPCIEQYLKIAEKPGLGAIAHFRMGQVYNRMEHYEQSRKHHYLAFENDPKLFSNILPQNLPHRNYVHQKLELIETHNCPICGAHSKAKRCYNVGVSYDFTPGFDPVRVWMHCEKCDHLFAHNRPKYLERVLKETKMNSLLTPDPKAFSEECNIIKRIMGFAKGDSILEVGSGIGEFAGVALEMLYQLECIEIRSYYAQVLEQKLKIKVHRCDFLNFQSNQKYNVLVMGDVIEHFAEPLKAMKQAYELLEEDGILWLSTPNFNSAHTRLLDHADPMWSVCEHLQFFSYESFRKLLDIIGFKVLDYQVSAKYNGSMEICARKFSV